MFLVTVTYLDDYYNHICQVQICTQMVIQYGWSPDDSPAIYITRKEVVIHSLKLKFLLFFTCVMEKK